MTSPRDCHDQSGSRCCVDGPCQALKPIWRPRMEEYEKENGPVNPPTTFRKGTTNRNQHQHNAGPEVSPMLRKVKFV